MSSPLSSEEELEKLLGLEAGEYELSMIPLPMQGKYKLGKVAQASFSTTHGYKYFHIKRQEGTEAHVSVHEAAQMRIVVRRLGKTGQ